MGVKLILWYTKFTLAPASPSLARPFPTAERQDRKVGEQMKPNDIQGSMSKARNGLYK
jgi:hypothetical protein